MRRPYVVAHAAVSLDGATTGFAPDAVRHRLLAATFRTDVVLTGADTGLLDEVSLLVHPLWSGGGAGCRRYGAGSGPPAGLRPAANRSGGDDLVRLCYRAERPAP